MDQFLTNLNRMHRYFSTWVAFLATAAAAYWLQMSPAEQQAILDAFPALKLLGPAIGFTAFVIARGIPQFPPAEAAQVDVDVEDPHIGK